MKQILSVISNTNIADKVYEIKLSGQFIKNNFKPGRFIHVKCGSGMTPLLRRPMSVCNINDSEKTMTVIYRADGKGTKLLADLQPNSTLDILGPLGSNFDLNATPPNGTALLIGGGVGVPPLYYLARELVKQGKQVKIIIGFNSAKDVFYANKFKELGDTYVTTIDGSLGNKGLVTDILNNNALLGSWNTMYSCGPLPMLRALQQNITEDKNAFISLEERMGCGVGACLACVCDYNDNYDKENKGYSRICTEGPVYPLHAIKL